MFRDNAYRLPAEWEPQSGVQLTWPHRDTDWAPMLDEVLAVYRQMAREISRREKLLVVAPEGAAPGMVHVTCPNQLFRLPLHQRPRCRVHADNCIRLSQLLAAGRFKN